MDLSKAFDCLPHDLLLLKLKYYGLSENTLSLKNNYLSNRKQCVKLGTVISSFKDMYKSVPRGSILGPVLFNNFINDIFYFITDSDLRNYADDNTLTYSYCDPQILRSVLTKDSVICVDWFSDNHMQTNPDTFQAIAAGLNSKNENFCFDLGNGCIIQCEDEVKLLDVTIDFKLKFDLHVSNICKKASRQLGILKRIGKNILKTEHLSFFYTF